MLVVSHALKKVLSFKTACRASVLQSVTFLSCNSTQSHSKAAVLFFSVQNPSLTNLLRLVFVMLNLTRWEGSKMKGKHELASVVASAMLWYYDALTCLKRLFQWLLLIAYCGYSKKLFVKLKIIYARNADMMIRCYVNILCLCLFSTAHIVFTSKKLCTTYYTVHCTTYYIVHNVAHPLSLLYIFTTESLTISQ